MTDATPNPTPAQPAADAPVAAGGYAGPGVTPVYASVPVAPVVVAAPQPKGLSVTSMVMGLVSIVFGFTFVVPVVGLVLGIIGLRREPAGKGMALTGVILSGLILLVWVLIIGGAIIASLIAAGAAAGYHPGN